MAAAQRRGGGGLAQPGRPAGVEPLLHLLSRLDATINTGVR